MEYELVCGLETHVELSTKTKLFCNCPTAFGGEPNTRCCPVCLGLPGSLPKLNREAVGFTVLAGLALGCTISPRSHMDRKNYCYPDLPKAYQISQYDVPLCRDGQVTLSNGRVIRIARIHLEEDAGKLIHRRGETCIDYNRCGVPLIEVVTEPDFRSVEEAREYLELLRLTMRYLGISDCKMQEGSLRSDVNVSLRPKGTEDYGVRTEIKNMNSFTFMERAMRDEARRQEAILRQGGSVSQETLRYLPEQDRTEPMRSKEDAQDYRFFPEPDLCTVAVSPEWVEELRGSLPELPREKQARFQREYGLPEEDAKLLVQHRKIAEYFDETAREVEEPRNAARCILEQVFRRLKTEEEKEQGEIPVPPEELSGLIRLLETKKIRRDLLRSTLETMLDTGKSWKEILKPEDLEGISPEKLRALCQKAIENNAKAAQEYRAGKEKALKALMGAVMRECRGKADPAQTETLLKALLQEPR